MKDLKSLHKEEGIFLMSTKVYQYDHSLIAKLKLIIKLKWTVVSWIIKMISNTKQTSVQTICHTLLVEAWNETPSWINCLSVPQKVTYIFHCAQGIPFLGGTQEHGYMCSPCKGYLAMSAGVFTDITYNLGSRMGAPGIWEAET